MSESTHVTVTDLNDGYAQRIEARNHQFAADEPAEVGGKDTGPTPYELLLAALGSCTTITVQMYARRKQWPLTGIQVQLSHRKIHARDCADCDQEDGFVDEIEKQIELQGPLNDEQRQRLLEIADRCPVNRTLLNTPKIRTSELGG